MPFNPNEHLINLERDRSKPARNYLECKWRLVWFRQDHPTATIETEIMHLDTEQQWAIVKAVIRTQDGALATGMVLQKPTSIAADYIANGETSAIGRALAALGYGTQFATELDEGDQVVDSPVERRPKPARPVTPAEVSGKTEPPADDLRTPRARLYAAFKALDLASDDAIRLMRHRYAKESSHQLTLGEINDLAALLEEVKAGHLDLAFGADGTPVLTSIDGPVPSVV